VGRVFVSLVYGAVSRSGHHEFKTPIVSIKGFAELLKDDSLPAEERSEYLDIIIRESSRLATMSTNVLNLSRIENQTIIANRKPIDVSEQIRRCILLLQSSWENRNIDMDIDLEDAVLNGNEEMLSQVWLNLLDNAIKFTPDGGRIALQLTKKDKLAVITIQDNGVGIAADELERIFDKFYHSDAGSAAPGNGIGLTLARKIVRLHGGDILCASSPGEGSLFTVTLPLF